MEKNSFGRHFFGITDFVFFFFEPSPPHNSQRIDANTDVTNNTTHRQTHHPFPAQRKANFIPSGTRLAQLCQDSCFLHDANMFAKQGMDRSTRTCTQREPTGRVIIVIETDREKRERERRKRTTKEREKKGERKRRDEREREPLLPPPLVGSKRLRVWVQNASVCAGKTRACVPHNRPTLRVPKQVVERGPSLRT